jgi:hypothetical protein
MARYPGEIQTYPTWTLIARIMPNISFREQLTDALPGA